MTKKATGAETTITVVLRAMTPATTTTRLRRPHADYHPSNHPEPRHDARPPQHHEAYRQDVHQPHYHPANERVADYHHAPHPPTHDVWAASVLGIGSVNTAHGTTAEAM